MASLHSLRSWLTRQLRRPLGRKPLRPDARLTLEPLEERLPPGDLLSLAMGWQPRGPLPAFGAGTATGPRTTATGTGSSSSAAPFDLGTGGGSTVTTGSTTGTSAGSSGGTSGDSSDGGFAETGGGFGGSAARGPAGGVSPIPGGNGGVPTGGSTSSGPSTGNPGNGGAPVVPPPGSPPGTSPPGSPPGAPPGSGNPVPASARVTAIRRTNGVNVMNKVSNDPRLTVVGVTTPGSAVKVYVDNKAVGTTISNASGVFAMRLNKLADGSHKFKANLASLPAPTNTQARVLVDTKAPGMKLDAAEFVRKQDAAWLQATVVETDFNGYQSKIYVDVDLNGDGKFKGSEVGYTTSMSEYIELDTLKDRDGTYRVRTRVRDDAGNWGVSPVRTVIIDSHAGYVGDSILKVMGGVLSPGEPPHFRPADFGKYVFVKDGMVMVDARGTMSKYINDFRSELKAIGFKEVSYHTRDVIVTGYLPIDRIRYLDQLPHFAAATPVHVPETMVGSVTSEGDAVMQSNTFRVKYNVDGTGVLVGVLSDSVDQFNGGIADSVATGDLPNGILVLSDFAGGTDEGRAMLEIVHDVAPGAGLAFATAFTGPTGFAQGIRDLAAAGARVITDDVRYVNSPHFSAGRMGEAVNEVTLKQNVFYTGAAGNQDDFGWRADFTPIKATVATVTGTFQSFGGSPLQSFTLPDGETLDLSFAWDSLYFEGGGIQVRNDLDVLLVRRDTGAIIATYTNDNRNTDEAFERIFFTNDVGTEDFAFAFQYVGGPAPGRLSWIKFGNTTVDTINADGEGATTIFGQALSEHTLATGAASATAGALAPEDFTSKGGFLVMVADDSGRLYSKPQVRFKPEVTGPDNVSTSFFIDGNPNASNTGFLFPGTSAATPHAAGAAALLLEQQPLASAFDLREHLIDTAVSYGADPLLGGAGMIQLRPLVLTPGTGEPNESSDRAINFGTVGRTEKRTGGAAIINKSNGLPDFDWYKLTAGVSGSIAAVLTNSSLALRVYRRDGNFLTRINVGDVVAAGTQVYFEVKGQNYGPGIFSEGLYTLKVKMS